MSIPDSPYRPNAGSLPRQSGSFSRNWLKIFPKLGGRGCPSSRLRTGLGIVHVDVARSSCHEQEDAPFRLGGEVATRPADFSVLPHQPPAGASRSAPANRNRSPHAGETHDGWWLPSGSDRDSLLVAWEESEAADRLGLRYVDKFVPIEHRQSKVDPRGGLGGIGTGRRIDGLGQRMTAVLTLATEQGGLGVDKVAGLPDSWGLASRAKTSW